MATTTVYNSNVCFPLSVDDALNASLPHLSKIWRVTPTQVLVWKEDQRVVLVEDITLATTLPKELVSAKQVIVAESKAGVCTFITVTADALKEMFPPGITIPHTVTNMNGERINFIQSFNGHTRYNLAIGQVPEFYREFRKIATAFPAHEGSIYNVLNWPAAPPSARKLNAKLTDIMFTLERYESQYPADAACYKDKSHPTFLKWIAKIDDTYATSESIAGIYWRLTEKYDKLTKMEMRAFLAQLYRKEIVELDDEELDTQQSVLMEMVELAK